MTQFRQLEEAFCLRHHWEPDHLSRGPRVVEELVESICRKPGSQSTRIMRPRTFIRISSLNKERRIQQSQADWEVEKWKQFAK